MAGPPSTTRTGTRFRDRVRGRSLGSRLSRDDEARDTPSTGWEKLRGLGTAIVAAALIFLAVIGWLTLQNTYTTVNTHSSDLTSVKAGVHQVVGFGTGLEWQLGILCAANNTDCTISPPGPPPR